MTLSAPVSTLVAEATGSHNKSDGIVMPLIRTVLALSLRSAAAVLTWRLLAWSTAGPLHTLTRQLGSGRSPAGGWTLDRLVTAGAAVGLVAACTVLTALFSLNFLGLCLASAFPALNEFAERVTPTTLRRAALSLCGLALAAPGMVPAYANDDPSSAPARGSTRLAGLPLPDLPSSKVVTTVTVRSGDSLWSIAERRLPSNSADTVVAMRVNRWYARNRGVIGSDPDKIFPGQRLNAPGGAA